MHACCDRQNETSNLIEVVVVFFKKNACMALLIEGTCFMRLTKEKKRSFQIARRSDNRHQ
jgi:hypothetical protein